MLLPLYLFAHPIAFVRLVSSGSARRAWFIAPVVASAVEATGVILLFLLGRGLAA
jgi:hypothetical protein